MKDQEDPGIPCWIEEESPKARSIKATLRRDEIEWSDPVKRSREELENMARPIKIVPLTKDEDPSPHAQPMEPEHDDTPATRSSARSEKDWKMRHPWD